MYIVYFILFFIHFLAEIKFGAFSLKISKLVATMLMIFCWESTDQNFVQFFCTQQHGCYRDNQYPSVCPSQKT